MSGLETLPLMMILLASVAGSLHCAAMCGGLSLAAGGGRLSSQWAYHLSRGAAYVFLGAWAGASGFTRLPGWESDPLRWMSIAGLFGILVLVRFSGGKLASTLARSGFRRRSAILIGLSSVLLPCGWLYAYVLIAGTSGTPGGGAGIMAAFWLGTLPALLGARILLQGMLAKAGIRGRAVASALLVIAAVHSLVLHWRHSDPGTAGSGNHAVCGSAPSLQNGSERQNQTQ